MRLKTISADTMPEALARLKELFGPDVLIIRTDETETNVRVTVAIEPAHRRKVIPPSSQSRQTGKHGGRGYLRDLRPLLDYHGVPFDLAERIERAARSIKADDLVEGLSRGLEICRMIEPRNASAPRPIMLVGPPGAGKSLAVQKLRIAPGIFGRSRLVRDSEGANPFDLAQMEDLCASLGTAGAEPVLVLPAGLDSAESGEIGKIYSALGCRRMIITRLDASRRLGGALAAADAGAIAIAALGSSPDENGEMQAATATGLAETMWRSFPASRATRHDRKEAS